MRPSKQPLFRYCPVRKTGPTADSADFPCRRTSRPHHFFQSVQSAEQVEEKREALTETQKSSEQTIQFPIPNSIHLPIHTEFRLLSRPVALPPSPPDSAGSLAEGLENPASRGGHQRQFADLDSPLLPILLLCLPRKDRISDQFAPQPPEGTCPPQRRQSGTRHLGHSTADDANAPREFHRLESLRTPAAPRIGM